MRRGRSKVGYSANQWKAVVGKDPEQGLQKRKVQGGL
jgi:hypothetical protein